MKTFYCDLTGHTVPPPIFPFDIVKVGKCYACKYTYKVAVILNILFLVYTLWLYAFEVFFVCSFFFIAFSIKHLVTIMLKPESEETSM